MTEREKSVGADPVIFDPYSRPPDRLNEVEPMILGAAFSAGSVTDNALSTTGALNGSQQGRMVPVVPGIPVLVSKNTKSETLVVTIQYDTYGSFFARFGKGPDYLTVSSAAFSFTGVDGVRTFRQILLAKEELWAVVDDPGLPVPPTHLIVSEVTP